MVAPRSPAYHKIVSIVLTMTHKKNTFKFKNRFLILFLACLCRSYEGCRANGERPVVEILEVDAVLILVLEVDAAAAHWKRPRIPATVHNLTANPNYSVAICHNPWRRTPTESSVVIVVVDKSAGTGSIVVCPVVA